MRGLVRVSLHLSRQDLDLAATLARRARGRIDRDAIARDDSVVRIAEGPGRLLRCLGDQTRDAAFEMLDDSARQPCAQSVALDDGDAFLKRRRVRDGRTGADRSRRIAEHIGDRERAELTAARALPQPPTRNRRQMLAHGIDLVDLCAAVHEQPVRSLHVGEGQSRRGLDEQRGRTASQDEKHRVILGRGSDGLHDPLRACETRRVRHGMPTFEYGYAPQSLTMTMLDEHRAGIDAVAEHRFESARERGGRLACAGHQNPAATRLRQRYIDRSAGTE